MKVFIITEGGRNIGFGHIARCVSLSEAFEEKGVETEFIINADDSVSNLLKGRKYRIFNWIKDNKKLFSIMKNAKIIIVDSYLASPSYYKKISKKTEFAVYLDDNKRLDFPKGMVVNGGSHAENLGYPKRKGTRYLLGTQYAPLREEYRDVPPKDIKRDIKSVMMIFGGDDKRNLTPRILKFLNNEYPALTKNVIIGAGFKNIKAIKKLKNDKVNFVYNPDATRMKEIIRKSDIAISAGGQTLHELARVGTPTIGICVAGNQRRHIAGLKRIGILLDVGEHSDRHLMKKIKSAMKKLGKPGPRKKMSETGKKFIDGKGSLRIARAILSDYFRYKLCIEKAKPGDARNIFNLSNDDTVRANSFCPEKFAWSHHVKWFRERLSDKNCVFFVLRTSGEFAGQLRFNLEPPEREATVNISLARNIRKLGLSVFALDRSISKLLKMKKGITKIKACIKEGNTPSIRSFEKANFKFLKNAIIYGNKAKIYARKVG